MELVLIRGLPGSGKTTMARVLALVGYEHHEADQYFERAGVYTFNAAELPKAHAWCLDRAQDSMARGASCVVANTFTRRWEMQPYLAAAGHGTADGNAASFYLSGRHPAVLKRLQSELSECKVSTALCGTAALAAMRLTIFDPFWEQQWHR